MPLLGVLIAGSLLIFDLTILRSGRTAIRPIHQKGIAIGLHQASKGMSYYRPVLDKISSLGATHLSIPVYFFQDSVSSVTLYSKPTDGATPEQYDRVVREVIEYVHRLGIKVLLAPIVDIDHPVGKEWRGVITPRDQIAWFDSYRAFLIHYAQIAEDLDVEFISVGTELVSTEEYTEEWRTTIRMVRKIYHGRLTYSANWDHYDEIEFWGDLDLLGISGYFELVSFENPTVDDLILGWSRIKPALMTWRAKWNMPLLFTEIGYTSQENTGSQPWNYVARAPVNLEEQRRCYVALKTAWEHEPHFAGLYLWNIEPGKGGPEDTGYTFMGKPAEEEVREWYRGTLPDATLIDIAVNAVERFFRSMR